VRSGDAAVRDNGAAVARSTAAGGIIFAHGMLGVCVCASLSLSLCMYICACVFVCVCMCVRVYVRVYMYKNTYIYDMATIRDNCTRGLCRDLMSIYVDIYIYISACTCMHAHICV